MSDVNKTIQEFSHYLVGLVGTDLDLAETMLKDRHLKKDLFTILHFEAVTMEKRHVNVVALFNRLTN